MKSRHAVWVTRAGALLCLLVAGCSSEPIPVQNPSCGPLGGCAPGDEQLALDGLGAPVDVVRDHTGRIHIYASTVRDAMLAEGYLAARDRAEQMNFLRRAGSGTLAEVFGDLGNPVIESDIAYRHIGLRRVAVEQYDRLDEELRSWLDAYADGVSQLFAEIRDGARPLSEGITIMAPQHFTDWSAVDSLTIARLQAWQLSYRAPREIEASELLDAWRTTFALTDPDPLVQKRAGLERDLFRFEPPEHATTIDGLGSIGEGPAPAPPEPEPASEPASERAREPHAPAGLLATAAGFRRALSLVRDWIAPEGNFGSNNWALGPARSATGRAMLASDPHLTLSSPSIFWPVSLHVEGAPEERLQVGGIAFPGLPGIILGHNEHIAWGATTTGYDVTDVYAETLTDGGDAVVFRGAEVPLETIEEVIALPNGESVTYEVKVVPHHGPVIPTIVDGEVIDPDPAVGALSVRWTGMEPTDDLAAIAGLLRARDVDEARAALRDFGTGSQSWMIADDAGNVAWTSHALVPYRDPAALDWDPAAFDGLLPCMVLPGDGTAEWTGLWDDDAVPWAKNPASAYLATANQDLVGGTLDNDPSNDQQPDGSSGYLGCQFAAGFRLARIRERIEAIDRLTLDDMASIQADVRSPLGNRLVPALLLAIESAQAEDSVPGSHPDLSEIVADAGYDAATLDDLVGLLVEWQATGYVAASGVSPDDNQALPLEDPAARASQATLVFNAWLVRMLARTFADEHARIGRSGTRHDLVALLHLFSSDPATLATYDPATGDSALFDDIDTPAIESRHERSIRALIDALSWIGEQGPLADLRWGHFHTLSLQPLLVLFPKLTVPPLGDPLFTNGFPRPGDSLGVDAANFSLRQPLGEDLDFSYGSGPAQRFVIELEPGKLVAHNAIPGGAVGRLGDPHFADQLERWRRNETFAVAFYASDVLAAQESRSLLTPR